MSNLQHKLFNLEAIPPENMWKKIAAEIEDSEIGYQYPSSLAALAIAPPNGVWEKISSELDAVNYPTSIKEKLLAYQETPPANTWIKIEKLLDAEKVAGTHNNQSKIFKFVKYAAAAMLIGAMAWGGFSLLDYKKVSETAMLPTPVLQPKNTIAVINDSIADENKNGITTVIPTIADEARNDAALEASKKTFAKLEIRNNRKIKNAANFYFGEITSGNVRRIDITDEIRENPMSTSINEASRYFLLMTPDGNIIRMSKKLGNLVCCVSGEDQDEDCKDQMKKWRQKMSTSSASHSPGNFMDIVSLVELLQDDNN